MKNCRIVLNAVCSAVFVLLAGCNNTPFAPLAVPTATAMRPDPIPVDCRINLQELLKIQQITIPPYRLMPGDTFSITVHGREDLTRPAVAVMSDGAISVFPVGYIKIGGLTIQEASAKLSQEYRKYVQDCNVIVEPVTIQQARVIVSGAVMKNGPLPIIVGRTRVMDAIAAAGGFAKTATADNETMTVADLDGAYIIRNKKVLPVSLASLFRKNDWMHNVPLMDGDYIYVPSMENTRITVLGEVENPGSLMFQPDLTLLQTIAKSGGLKITNSQVIKVIRGGLVNPRVYNINIKDMQLGRLQDFRLVPKDIVFVPRDPISEWNVLSSLLLPSIQLLNGLAGPFGSPSAFIYK